MDRVLELDLDAATKLVVGNYVNQLHLIQLVVPGMLERGGGRVVNMASATASMDPPAPAGEGGWGLGYGASKAAFLRVAGQLHVEFASQGIVAVQRRPRLHHQRQAQRRAVRRALPRRAARGDRRRDPRGCARPTTRSSSRARSCTRSRCASGDILLEGWPRTHETTTPKTMTAYQLVGWSEPPEFREVDVPVPGRDEVLIKVAGVGLCHSDFLFLDTPPGIIPWRAPVHARSRERGVGGAARRRRRRPRTRPSRSRWRASTRAVGASSACAARTTTARVAPVVVAYGEDGGLAQYLLVPRRELVPLRTLDPRRVGPLTDAGGDLVPRGEARARRSSCPVRRRS